MRVPGGDAAMRMSLCIDPGRSWTQVLALAQRVDSAGWHAVYVSDHFMPHDPAGRAADGPVLECWTVLAALAAQTATVRLGSLVLGNSYRHPAVVANMAATLDQVSGGRLLLGLGAGSQPNEHHAYGIELLSPSERISRFAEGVEVIASLLRSEHVTFRGSYYSLDAARCEPTSLQRPLPLLVGGAGERRSIPLAARFADAWHAWTTPEQFRHKSRVLDAACAAVGRDPADVRRLTGQVLLVG